MARRWHRRRPVAAGLAVAAAAYVLLGLSLRHVGGADPAQAWGVPTVIGAATVWYVAWAVFSRDGDSGDAG